MNQRNQSVYVGAPYNFIEFPGKWVERYPSVEELPPHNSYVNELLSGRIEFTWTAVTPVCVGAGRQQNEDRQEVHPFQNHEGYAIPGNTVRGLIRSHVQILGMSNVRDDLADKTFLYRDLAKANSIHQKQYNARIGVATTPKQREEQKKRGGLPDKLRAGYIEWAPELNHYRILPAEEDAHGRQFYRISEKELRKMDLSGVKGIHYMYQADVWSQLRGLSYKKNRQEINNILKNNVLRGRFRYKPYFTPVRFSLNPEGTHVKHITDRNSASGKGWTDGYLLSSGFILGKKVHYVIREAAFRASGSGIVLDDQWVDEYNNDLVRNKHDGGQWTFYHLPKKNEPGSKPVFYAEHSDRIYFGFTPYLRIFYDYSIFQGLPAVFREGDKLDYAKSLFGFTNYPAAKGKRASYKTRLSFSDLQAEGTPHEMPGVAVTLAGPKATAYPLYLKQPEAKKNRLFSYNDKEFQLRGIKKYWNKEKAGPQASENGNNQRNENVKTTLHPLPEGTGFRGCIRFSNLAQDELGLVLWALLLNDQCTIQVGMGKPYGYGQIKLSRDSVRLWIEMKNRKYSDHFTFAGDYMKEDEPDKYIADYKQHMKETQRIEVDEDPGVRSLLKMLSQQLPGEKTRYMSLKEFKQPKALPTIDEVISGKARYYRQNNDRRGQSSSHSSSSFGTRGKGSGRNHSLRSNSGRNMNFNTGGKKHGLDDWQKQLKKWNQSDHDDHGQNRRK